MSWQEPGHQINNTAANCMIYSSGFRIFKPIFYLIP
jgi:hypothetical protein